MKAICGKQFFTKNDFINMKYTRTGNNAFDKILDKKEISGMTAKEFLATLSPKELFVIQKQNGLADSIRIEAVGTEGAENLLISRSNEYELLDLDNDSIVDVGIARSFIFPPPNTAPEVKEAWAEMTEGMSLKEKILLEFPFMVAALESNMSKLPNGSYEIIHPGDNRYKNIFGTTVEEFLDVLNKVIERTKNPLHSRTVEEMKIDDFRLKHYNVLKEMLLTY